VRAVTVGQTLVRVRPGAGVPRHRSAGYDRGFDIEQLIPSWIGDC
jgi:hypothetical protein